MKLVGVILVLSLLGCASGTPNLDRTKLEWQAKSYVSQMNDATYGNPITLSKMKRIKDCGHGLVLVFLKVRFKADPGTYTIEVIFRDGTPGDAVQIAGSPTGDTMHYSAHP